MKDKTNIAPINEDLNIPIYEVEEIKQKIYYIRGKQVMLDSDVAELYNYSTKRINESVKRNIDRFPEEFCFQLTKEEVESSRSQIATLNDNSRGKNIKYLPYVFTEQGVAMLAGILKSESAVKISINIIKAFIAMRDFLIENGQVFKRLTKVEYKLLEYDSKFDKVFDELQKNKHREFKEKIFFEGQIWDSYSLIVKIIRQAKEKILIIDNYIDDTILDLISKKNKNVEVIILTSNRSNISQQDLQKFNKEYPTLKLAKTEKFHDRFIVIDNNVLYHIGASLKDLGNKCFAINKMEDIEYINRLIKIVK